jgi:hypothetical protein
MSGPGITESPGPRLSPAHAGQQHFFSYRNLVNAA